LVSFDAIIKYFLLKIFVNQLRLLHHNHIPDPFSDANSIMSATSGDSFPLNKTNKSDDPFYKKSHDTTSSTGGSIGKSKSHIISDDFFASTAKMGDLNAFTAAQSQIDKADFFDSFNDQFTKNSSSKNYASAFGDDTPVGNDENKNTSAFDAFNDDFGDDFSKLQITTTTSTNTAKSTTLSDDTNFAQFDAFTSAFDVTNNNNNNNVSFDAFSQLKNTGNLKLKKNDWFKDDFDKMAKTTTTKKVTTTTADEDFSKGDTFDADLDAVLKRSMIDQ
jgi:hypothetical protein